MFTEKLSKEIDNTDITRLEEVGSAGVMIRRFGTEYVQVQRLLENQPDLPVGGIWKIRNSLAKG